MNSEYLRIAYDFASKNSDDPRTQTGAVIINRDGEVVAFWTNRIPLGVIKLEERITSENKPDYIGHAERNSVANAARMGIRTRRLTMFAPWAACSICAQAIIEGGIARLVVHKQMMDLTPGKWQPSIRIAMTMLKEAQVKVEYHDDPKLRMGILFNGSRI